MIKHRSVEKLREMRENDVIDQFQPLLNHQKVQFGMAVATLLRLGVYGSVRDLIRCETRKTGAYIRDQVQETIITSARSCLRDVLTEKLGSEIYGISVKSNDPSPNLCDTFITDSYDVIVD